MRFTDFSIALMAMTGSVCGQQQQDTATNLNEVRPGHIGDMTALPYEIQRCIKLNIPMAWTDDSAHLDLFCDKNSGKWHQDLPICIANAFPSSAADALAAYNTFSSRLCEGYAGPGMPLTTIITASGSLITSTIFPTPSETKYVLPDHTSSSTSTSHACIWGKEVCRQRTMYDPVVTLRTETSEWTQWTQSNEYKMPTSTPWGVSTRPITTVAILKN